MIIEDYVSFETSKLLKEKGFPQEYDIYHSMVYNEEDYEDEYEVQRMVLETRLVKAGTLSPYPIGVHAPKCYCPTLQMAMKYLREVHNLHIIVDYDTILSWYYQVKNLKEKVSYDYDDEELVIYHNDNESSYSSYEGACEAALKYCLENLI